MLLTGSTNNQPQSAQPPDSYFDIPTTLLGRLGFSHYIADLARYITTSNLPKTVYANTSGRMV